MKVGDPAPRFRLPSSGGSYVSLEDFLGKKNLFVYFYVKDFKADAQERRARSGIPTRLSRNLARK